MLRRITADWDFKNPLKILFYLYRCYTLSPKEITIKKSNSKGYHVILWLDLHNKVTKKFILILRAYIGDDKKRIEIDKKRKISRQYLFYKKVKL